MSMSTWNTVYSPGARSAPASRCDGCSCFFFFSSRRRHTRCSRDWSSDVCSSDLYDTEPRRSIFASLWFRVLLVVIVLGVAGVLAVPYVLDVMNPPPPKPMAVGTPAAPALPLPAPAPAPAPEATHAAPSPTAPAPAPAAPATTADKQTEA